jgi:hypothetical protein
MDISPYILAQIPTWFIFIVGWYVVHHLTLKREQRKEVRERVDVFLGLLHEIEEKAFLFHQSHKFDGNIARALRAEIQRTIYSLNRHTFSEFNIDSGLLRDLRQAITYRNFEPSNFVCQSPESSILSDIVDAVDKVKEQIEREYERIYY